MYNACDDPINESILRMNSKMSDLNSAINSDKRITDSDCYKKMQYNSQELSDLLTHSVEYTERDQCHDRYWDRVEESDAVKDYAESTERRIRHQCHQHDFIKHYNACTQLLNEEQSENLDQINDWRQEREDRMYYEY